LRSTVGWLDEGPKKHESYGRHQRSTLRSPDVPFLTVKLKLEDPHVRRFLTRKKGGGKWNNAFSAGAGSVDLQRAHMGRRSINFPRKLSLRI